MSQAARSLNARWPADARIAPVGVSLITVTGPLVHGTINRSGYRRISQFIVTSA